MYVRRLDSENRHGAPSAWNVRRPEAPTIDRLSPVCRRAFLAEIADSQQPKWKTRAYSSCPPVDDLREQRRVNCRLGEPFFEPSSLLSIRQHRRRTILRSISRENFSGGKTDANSIRFERAYAAQWLRPLKLDSRMALRGNLLCWLLDQGLSIPVFYRVALSKLEWVLEFESAFFVLLKTTKTRERINQASSTYETVNKE